MAKSLSVPIPDARDDLSSVLYVSKPDLRERIKGYSGHARRWNDPDLDKSKLKQWQDCQLGAQFRSCAVNKNDFAIDWLVRSFRRGRVRMSCVVPKKTKREAE